MREDSTRTIGLDLGDRWTHFCELDAAGAVVERGRVRTSRGALEKRFGGQTRCRGALEGGAASPWVSRLLEERGHEVVVANPRQVRLITQSDRKSDRQDAELLARLARTDPGLLAPVRHRDAQAQADRSLLTAREAAVASRTLLVNHVRGVVKSFGERLPACSTASFPRKVEDGLPAALRPALEPLLHQIAALTKTIRGYDRAVEEVSTQRYPVTAHLRQIRGVGPLTALAYVLAIGDPKRFAKSRRVGAYLGLAPRRDQSGARDPQLRITKAGDGMVRRLLLQCAHYILGPFGIDCDLRRWAEARTAHGGRAARKRALVAVARKLAVRMHRLWSTGEIYDPLHLAKAQGQV